MRLWLRWPHAASRLSVTPLVTLHGAAQRDQTTRVQSTTLSVSTTLFGTAQRLHSARRVLPGMASALTGLAEPQQRCHA